MKLLLQAKAKIKHAINNSFDLRMVRYEEIHNIKDEYFDHLTEAVCVQENDVILDVGSGYGAVTRELYKRNIEKVVEYHLADSSYIQLNRAKEEMEATTRPYPINNSKFKFVIDNIVKSEYQSQQFDKVVAKMVLHEIHKSKQQKAINEVFRILKPGGKVIIWDMALDNENQVAIQNIFRKKDRLAGFKTMVQNRYFLRLNEIIDLLEQAGFDNIQKEYDILSPVTTSKRLTAEFKGDVKKLDKWHQYIREILPTLNEVALSKLEVVDNLNSMSFIPPKAIITATK